MENRLVVGKIDEQNLLRMLFFSFRLVCLFFVCVFFVSWANDCSPIAGTSRRPVWESEVAIVRASLLEWLSSSTVGGPFGRPLLPERGKDSAVILSYPSQKEG